jgi:hypothetical protein
VIGWKSKTEQFDYRAAYDALFQEHHELGIAYAHLESKYKAVCVEHAKTDVA